MSTALRQLDGADWPPLLTEINDPPKSLWVQGELPPYEWKWLAVVGSRALSRYGQEACEKLIAGLAGYPIVIVSGLALGADACAHRAALAAGLPTVAVPGSGLDPSVLYPRTNTPLAREIIASGGALLSEFEPKFRATTWSFPQRNRIMAGLSHATFVIEAGIKSGTLITSRLATEYNRDVFALPGSIFSTHSEGPHMLIRLGATPITKSEDILEALGFGGRAAQGGAAQTPLPLDLSPIEQKIFDALENPLPRDDLIRLLDLPPHEVTGAITMLELKSLLVTIDSALHRR